MAKKTNKPSVDLQGAGRLTVDAIKGISNIVESLHQTIANFIGLATDQKNKKTVGISGMVYRNIHSITAMVGNGIDELLGKLGLMLGEQNSSANREAILSALNGILGDHLQARENPLAIKMQLRCAGKPLDPQALQQKIIRSNGKLLLMLHGSCMNDLQWNRNGHDHGANLAKELGIETVYLHYNSGLHISENGRQLAELLETQIKPQAKLTKLYFIAHSMGGLVARSACYYAEQMDYSWQHKLEKMIFLGTPHHGAVLEKAGNWLDTILESNPFSAPFAKLGKVRSSGISDLRYGNILDDDWQGRDRFEFSEDQRTPVPLPASVSCYAIASSTRQADKLTGNIIGDGLVTLNSALGIHQNSEHNLGFKKTNQWIGREINHMEQLSHPKVYAILKQYIQESDK